MPPSNRLLELLSLESWAAWFAELDRGFIFLLLLPFVVALIGLWAWFTEDERPADESAPRPWSSETGERRRHERRRQDRERRSYDHGGHAQH